MEYILDGYCGVYCGACPTMLASKTGILDERHQCYGCKSERPTGFCNTCGIKACAIGKGFNFCLECTEVRKCELLLKFMSDQQYPYGQCVLKNMESILASGLTNWLKAQETRWSCEYCGEPYSWYQDRCTKCGMAVSNYQADL